MNILVTGANGQLGNEIQLIAKNSNDNYILVPKGKYVITTSVCDAKYSSSKDISQDVEITLKGK